MDKLETLKVRLENEIEKAIKTLLEIEELEIKEPWRKLSNFHNLSITKIFYHILLRSLRDRFQDDWLTFDEQLKYVQKITNKTYKHFKDWYWFDTKIDIHS